MESKIVVDQVENKDNRITVKFHTEGVAGDYFNPKNEFWAEYSEDISEVPSSIGVVAFVCNVLPIIWLTDSELILQEIDKDFYESIDEFQRGYEKMYPQLMFSGKVVAGQIVSRSSKVNQSRSACFFSGGVDAFCTLYRHAEEHPVLVTLWGSDIRHDDLEGWKIVSEHVKSTAQDMGCDYSFIKTNFRTFINNTLLDELVINSGDSYWHGFHHGIGLIGHIAPLVWSMGLLKVYIASSYTIGDVYTCASDPTIDNYVRYCGASTIHDGYEFTRQMKIHFICNFVESHSLSPILRVCWRSRGGRNCCKCEKCMRTMFEIFAEGRDPLNFGFEYDRNHLKQSRKRVLLEYNPIVKPVWSEIQNQVQKIPDDKLPNGTHWVKKCNFEKEQKGVDIMSQRVLRKIYCQAVKVAKALRLRKPMRS